MVEGLSRVLVLDELDRIEEARPPDVAHDRQVEQLRQRLPERVLRFGDVLHDAIALHDLDVLQRHRRLHGMAAERDSVRIHLSVLHEGLRQPIGRHHSADCCI